MARNMKDSGIEWIGEIPEGWEVVPVKRLCTMQAGKNLTSEQIAPEGTYPVYGGNGIRGFFSDYNCDGQFLTVGRQGALCGNVHKINGKVWATEHAVITTPSSYTSLDFLYYLLIGMDLNQYVSSTAAQPGLAVGTLLNLKTCYPCSTLEQTRISNYLNAKCSEIDVMLSKTRSSIEEYKKLKQAVITQAVTKGVRGEREMKDSGVEWIGTYPSNWKIIKIKWLLHERKDRSVTGLEEPLSMSQKKGLIPTKDMDSIPNMASSFIGAKLVYKGDLVFNKLKAHLGVFSVSKYNGLVSPDYAVYYSTGPANLNFLELLFKTPQYINEFKKKSSGVGAGLTRLYTGDLYSIYCALPPLVEQEKIADYLDIKCAEIDKLIAKKEQLVKELESYKKSLIYEVVTGKREV